MEDVDMIMGGRIDDTIEFVYFDTEPELAVAIETGSGHAITLEPDRVIDVPEDRVMASLDGIAVVVEEIESVMAAYTRLLGWEPWAVSDRRELIEHVVVSGEAVEPSDRSARTRIGPVTYELIEPGEAASPERAALKERGPGLHHIRCSLPKPERARVLAALPAHGLTVDATSSEPGAETLYVDGPVGLKLHFR
jgi:hypothetical protein